MAKWWRAWYGGPMLMAVAFTVASVHYACSPGHAKTEKSLMAKVSKHIHKECREAGDVVYIDVTYDKTLIPRVRQDGFPIGEVAITDRHKLFYLLQQLSADTSYRGIILDVSLNASTPTDADSALAGLLCQMPRTVISHATERGLIDARLQQMAGQTAYPTGASEAGFVKYPLLQDDEESMPLKLYGLTEGRKLRHIVGNLYLDGWALACGNLFTTLTCRVPSTDTLYLGDDIVEGDFLAMQGKGFLRDKVIVIGAISEGDIHNSYAGDISGPEINLNTYMALKHGQHRIGFLTLMMLAGFFYLLSFSIVRSQWKLTDRLQRSRWWPLRAGGLILSGFIYSILLKIPFLLNYLLFGQVLTFTTVAMGFLIINKIVQTNKMNKR